MINCIQICICWRIKYYLIQNSNKALKLGYPCFLYISVLQWPLLVIDNCTANSIFKPDTWHLKLPLSSVVKIWVLKECKIALGRNEREIKVNYIILSELMSFNHCFVQRLCFWSQVEEYNPPPWPCAVRPYDHCLKTGWAEARNQCSKSFEVLEQEKNNTVFMLKETNGDLK